MKWYKRPGVPTAFVLVAAELDRASARFGAFNSTHEGYAVIAEELDELWDAVKKNDADHAAAEAIQVAAMAVRFMRDCGGADTDEPKGGG